MPDCRLASPSQHLDRLPMFLMGALQLQIVCLQTAQVTDGDDIWGAAFEKSVNTLKWAPKCLENGIILAVKALKKSHL